VWYAELWPGERAYSEPEAIKYSAQSEPRTAEEESVISQIAADEGLSRTEAIRAFHRRSDPPNGLNVIQYLARLQNNSESSDPAVELAFGRGYEAVGPTATVEELLAAPSEVQPAKDAEFHPGYEYRLKEPFEPSIELTKAGKPVLEHFEPYSIAHNERPENLFAACQICNGIKSDLIFKTVDKARHFIEQEWNRRNYTKCPPLVPFYASKTIYGNPN
jgi:hypothetical protein